MQGYGGKNKRLNVVRHILTPNMSQFRTRNLKHLPTYAITAHLAKD